MEPRSCPGRSFGLRGLNISPHRDSADRQIPRKPEIGLHQRPHDETADLGRQQATRRSDSALPAEATGPDARADRALGDRPLGRVLQCRPDVLRAHVPPLDVVQEAVVAFPDHHIDGAGSNADLRTLPDGVLDEAIGYQADVERAGERDGCLDHAELADLFEAAGLAEPVDRVDGCPDLLAKQVAAVGPDDRDARAHGPLAGAELPLARPQCDVPHQDARHIRDGVVPAHWQVAGHQPDLPGSPSLHVTATWADIVVTTPPAKVNFLLQSDAVPPNRTVQSTARTPSPFSTPLAVTAMEIVSSPYRSFKYRLAASTKGPSESGMSPPPPATRSAQALAFLPPQAVRFRHPDGRAPRLWPLRSSHSLPRHLPNTSFSRSVARAAGLVRIFFSSSPTTWKSPARALSTTYPSTSSDSLLAKGIA